MIGRAKEDCLITADGIQIQNRRRARQEKQGAIVPRPQSQVSDERHLGRMVQILLDHVDDKDPMRLCLQRREESDQSVRPLSAILDEPGQIRSTRALNAASS